MQKAFLSVVLAVVLLFLNGPALDACGDKLLVLGRGVRFQYDIAEYPASILHYMNPAKEDAGGTSDSKLRSYLGQAGHKLQSVRNAKDFEQALKTGKYDLVLLDFFDAPAFEEIILAAPSKPLLLPFVYTGKKTDVSAAKQRYGVVLKAPARVVHLLDTIDSAMQLKQKRQPRAT